VKRDYAVVLKRLCHRRAARCKKRNVEPPTAKRRDSRGRPGRSLRTRRSSRCNRL